MQGNKKQLTLFVKVILIGIYNSWARIVHANMVKGVKLIVPFLH